MNTAATNRSRQRRGLRGRGAAARSRRWRPEGGAQVEEQLAPSVVAGLQRAIADNPVPADYGNKPGVRPWREEMSRRLAPKVPDARSRDEFVATVHYEATRAGLDPQLVLGVIQHESNFRKYAISSADARGYMQVMPFWAKLIGTSEHNLFHLRTNLRYGCVILRHYLDTENGDLYRALGRYNGSLGRPEYPNAVLATMNRNWLYAPASAPKIGHPAVHRRGAVNAGVDSQPPHYRGRYAPSPTGPLHFGSLVAALASYCDARAARGHWRVRIEDVDVPRSQRGAEAAILTTLERYGFAWDGDVVRQSARTALYDAALDRLRANADVYECACSRRELETAAIGPGGERVYPGTCRDGIPANRQERAQRALRVRVGDARIEFRDRLQGLQVQDLARDVGDFVVRRADGLYAYQLAVVVDDALQQITHVVRGADLLASTPRQILLQRRPRLSVAVLSACAGCAARHAAKSSPSKRVPRRCRSDPVPALLAAWRFLGQPPPEGSEVPATVGDFWSWALTRWSPSQLPPTGMLPRTAAVRGRARVKV